MKKNVREKEWNLIRGHGTKREENSERRNVARMVTCDHTLPPYISLSLSPPQKKREKKSLIAGYKNGGKDDCCSIP